MAKGQNGAAPGKYVPPHEKKSGWDEYEMDDALRTLRHAGEIVANKAFVAALKKHADEKAAEHADFAKHMESMVKSGKISSEAAEKMGKR